MATFCSKCGTSLTSDTGFCPSCGAPIGTAAAPSQPEIAAAPPVLATPPPPTYAQPAAAYPAPPPQKSGGVLKVVLIVIAVVVVLGVLGVGILGYVGYRAMHAAGNAVSMGQSADISDADLGVSVYPGAVRNPNGAVRLKLGTILTVSAQYSTADSASSVLAFYQDKLGTNVTTRQTGESTTLSSATVNDTTKETLVITVTPTTQNGTQIVIAHTKSGG
jgi:hypothetical protein